MYNEDDTHDSIDGIQYPDESYIYDRCDGYAMVVMKSDGWEGNEEINIYFEDRDRRYGARWTSVEDARAYEKSSNGRFFSDEDFEDFYFVLNSAPNDVISLKEPFPRVIINEAHITTIENLPSNYQNGIWAMVEYDEGMYGLMYADPDTKQARVIIKGDIPTDTHFVAKKDERGYYIEGKFKNYWLEKLSDNDEGDGKQHLEISYFLDDKSYAIVTYEDNGKRRFGLYDLNRKELIIKDAYDLSEKCDDVYVSYGDYAILYDYKNRKPLTRPFVDGRDVHQAPLMFSYKDYRNPNNEYYIYSNVNQKEYGPFRRVGDGINYDNLVIVEALDEQNFERIFDVDKGDFVGEEKFQYILPENRFFCKAQKPNGAYYPFDNLRQRCLCEIDDVFKICTLYDHGIISLFSFKYSDGGLNIYSPKYGIVLPYKATDIHNYYTRDKNVVSFFTEQSIFFLMLIERYCRILPSSRSFPKKNVLNCYLNSHSYTDVIAEVTIGIDFRSYRVTYNPGKNEIIGVKDVTTNQDEAPVTPEVISQIEQMFFPDKAQIAEQFKNIMNRMNDL